MSFLVQIRKDRITEIKQEGVPYMYLIQFVAISQPFFALQMKKHQCSLIKNGLLDCYINVYAVVENRVYRIHNNTATTVITYSNNNTTMASLVFKNTRIVDRSAWKNNTCIKNNMHLVIIRIHE